MAAVWLFAPQSFDTNPSCSFLRQCHIIEECAVADLCWQLCYEVEEGEMKKKAVLWCALLARSYIIVLIYRDRWPHHQMSFLPPLIQQLPQYGTHTAGGKSCNIL